MLTKRDLLAGGALAAAGTQLDVPAMAQVLAQAPEVTRILADYLVAAKFEDLPPAVRKEAARSFLNWVGVTLGGSRQGAVTSAVAALSPFSGKAQANLLGRSEKLDILHAALINGISSHVLDFDDTHLKTIIHPAGPVASALLALGQDRPLRGSNFLNAMVLGIETECRIGNAVFPSHYDMGWHITGSCGVFGAAAACGKVLGLSRQQMIWALGLAASQPVGLKVQFGSMTKSFHAGRAAQNGLTAALLAAQNFTSDNAPLEGKDGWAQALSRQCNWREVTEGLGSRYEAALNTYKPFACGIVTHPGIDAAIRLRNDNSLRAADIAAIELHANPLVLALTGKTDPRTGLESKFSIYHCIAAAVIFGMAGEKQFQDAVVNDPAVVALRRLVTVRTDPAVKTRQSDLTILLKDGRQLTLHVENAIGSAENPMSDAALEAKFTDLADSVLPQARIRDLIALCWAVERAPDMAAIARAASV